MIDFRGTADFMAVFALLCGIINFGMVYVPDLLCKVQEESMIEEEKDVDMSIFTNSRAWSITSNQVSIAGPRQYRETLFDAIKESDRY